MINIERASSEDFGIMVSKFRDMEMSLIKPKDGVGEKAIKMVSEIIDKFKENGFDYNDSYFVVDSLKNLINLKSMSSLSFKDEEWIETNMDGNKKAYMNCRNTSVWKICGLIFPKIHTYRVSTKTDSSTTIRNAPNIEISNGKLTGRFIADWYLQYDKGPKKTIIVGDCSDSIELPAEITRTSDGGTFITHSTPYEVDVDSVLLPLYLKSDELTGLSLEEFSKMGKDDIKRLMLECCVKAGPEQYTREEKSNSI